MSRKFWHNRPQRLGPPVLTGRRLERVKKQCEPYQVALIGDRDPTLATGDES